MNEVSQCKYYKDGNIFDLDPSMLSIEWSVLCGYYSASRLNLRYQKALQISLVT